MSFEATNLARKMASSNEFRPGELHVMLLLADHANEEWVCWPSLELLAMDTCMGERTVRRHLRALEERGVLVCDALYDSRSGARIGNQFRLVESAMERLAQAGAQQRAEMKERMGQRRSKIRHSKTVSIDTGVDAESEPSAILAGGDCPANTSPAKMAGGEKTVPQTSENPVTTSPAKLAGGGSNDDVPPAKLANPSSNLAKNTEVPLKERARINHHHQSSDARTFDPVAIPVTDDDDDSKSAVGQKVEEASVPLSEVYHGVDLGALHHMVPAALQSLSVQQVRSVIDIVLARATSKVNSPLRYVAASCRQDSESLYAAVTGLSAVTGPVATISGGFADQDAPTGYEPGFIGECESHDWSSKNPDSICPGCNANYLTGESHLNPRPGKPERGWFRTSVLLNDKTPRGETADVSLPWGPDDDPDF